MGDFNSEPNWTDAVRQLKNYPFFNQLSSHDKSEFSQYYYAAHQYLQTLGYLQSHTSKFGGKPGTHVQSSVIFNTISSPNRLSDHNAIQYEIRI